MLNLDIYDIKILEILTQNGRINNNELAEKISLSPSACLRRIRTLEEKQIIEGYNAKLNVKLLGLTFEAFVNVTLRKDQSGWHERFEKALNRWPEVVGAYIVTGDTQYILHILTDSLESFSDFIINRLYKEESVMEMQSNIILGKPKDNNSTIGLGHLLNQ